MRTRYPIRYDHQLKNKIYYPADLKEGSVISKVAFGSKSLEVECLPHPLGRKELWMGEDIQRELHLPKFDIKLHLFIKDQTLFIGPLIGIFTSGFTPFLLRPIGERSLFFSKLLSVKNRVGVLPFVFGEQHIDWDSGLIKGYFYGEEGWQQFDVPFPNVIYDRLPNRKSEKTTEYFRIKDRLQQEYLIPWYNPGFFNKLDIFERLQQDDLASGYLPETYPFSSLSLIERMLADYGQVFVKPIHGSLGLGIHQILYDRVEGNYYCRYRDRKGENKLRRFDTLEALMRNIFSGKKLSRMIVQQGIRLLRIDQRQVDFRVHTNKDANGDWKVSAIAAKVAGPGSVTTHLNNGGVIKTMEELFDNKTDCLLYKRKLEDAALNLSKALERNMEGILAEIGFDFGIDRKGNLWLFEANSKPGRSIFKHPQMKEFDLLTREFSLAFAVFLTEQALSNPEEMFQ